MIASRNLFSAFIFLFSLSMFFTSCEKDNISPTTNNGNNTGTIRTSNLYTGGGQDGTNGDCFSIVYPIELNFSDGTSTTVNNDDELETAIDAWFETQGEDAEDPIPTFPVTVTLEDGTEQVIQDMAALETLFDDCFGDYDDEYDDEYDEYLEDCFDLVYPVELSFPDGSTQSVNNDDELEAAIDAWFESQGEDVEEEPTFVYPITIVWDDDTEQVISNDDELEEAFEVCEDHEDCYEEEDDFEECFTFNYPISFTLEDGTSTTVNSDDELYELFDMADENETDLEIVYPITVTMTEDNTEVDVNNDNELDELFESCD